MANTVQVEVNQVGRATSEGVVRGHRVLIDRPEAKGGDDRGAMGGELLLVSLAGCFMSNLLAAIRERDADISNVRTQVSGSPPPGVAGIRKPRRGRGASCCRPA